MKRLTTFCLALLALSLVSCGEKTKQITPQSIDFKGGSLSNLVELVSAPYTLNCDGITHVNVQLRLKRSLPHFTELSINDIELKGTPLTLNLYDVGGNEIEELELGEGSYDTLRKLLQGNEGDIVEVVFTYDDNVKLKNVASLSAHQANSVYPMMYTLEGGIGNNQVVMSFMEYPDNTIHGAYYYKKYARMGTQAYLYLKGDRKSNNVLEIAEFTLDGYNSGSFVGKISNKGYKGEFVANMNLKRYIFDLRLNNQLRPLDFSAIDFDRFYDYISHYEEVFMDAIEAAEEIIEEAEEAIEDYDNDNNGASSGDISKLLDEYEDFVDEYIKVAKKAANGDASALLHYPKLMQEAAEYAEEAEECKGDMTAKDLKRLQQINLKIMEAVVELE
jgi:hypothetical protein